MVNPAESIPAKSNAYLYAQSAFFAQFNDVDFYVEDQSQKSLYTCILGRLFPKLTVDRIFPLGGKGPLLQHAAANKTSRKSIYILDKDFDDLLGTKSPLPRLVYLDRYCIENYVLEPDAIRRFIVSEKPSETIALVEHTFDVGAFLAKSVSNLRSLFFHFLLVQKYALGLDNTGMHIARFTEANRGWLVDQAKVQSYQRQVIAACSALTSVAGEKRQYASAFELRRRKALTGQNISGKYLLALLLRRITNAFNVPGTDAQSGMYRIAEYCSFRTLIPVHQEIDRQLLLQKSRQRRPVLPRTAKKNQKSLGVSRRQRSAR